MLSRAWLIFILFFVSGACGLIYQVVWSRMMSLIFGRSVLAVGIVLAAFMAGLALGSYALGRYADKSRNPFRLYAIYEIGIGFTALTASFCLAHISPVYLWTHAILVDSPLLLSVVRFLLAFSILIVPTVLMGATLPLLSRVVITGLDRVGHELGKLYAINTIGAVAGTLCAGFYLIGHLGLQGTIYVAVAGNLVVGVFAWVASFRPELTNVVLSESSLQNPLLEPSSVDKLSRKTYRLLLFAFALSGLTSFSYEIFWTRSLVFILGNTTYAFTLMLTAFLSGIALGGYGIRFVAARVKNRLRLFAAIEILIGVLSAASLPLLFYILESESVQTFVLRMSSQLGLLALSESAVALVIMLLPATLIGATLPLMGQIFINDLQKTSETVGTVYAANTMGNVVGALLPGLLILPLVGVQKGILIMALLNVCLGIVVLVSRWKNMMVMATATSFVFLAFAYAIANMQITFQFPSESQTSKDSVSFYKEGGLVTTKVWTGVNSGKKMISVDGINIGGTNDADYKQQILAHLPKLLLKSYKSELSIGLGSGILIGESGRHDALKKIVCAEISTEVVEGAKFFTKENYDILNDPRAEIVVDDVNHFLQTSSERYDIVSADGKTAEKYSTNAFSYSKEYYELLRQRLTPGGLVIQWVPTALPSTQYSLVLRTFLDSFPHVTLWYFPPVGRFFLSNTFLVGSAEPVIIDPVWMQEQLAENAASFHGIRKYGLTTAEDLLAHFVAGEKTLRHAVPPGPVNTFDKPYYEFYSPRDYVLSSSERVLENHKLLQSIRGPDFERYIIKGLPDTDRVRLRDAFQAEAIFLDGYALQLRGEDPMTVLQYYDQAVGTAPRSKVLRNEVLSYLTDQFRLYYSKGDYANALGLLRVATELYPESAEAHEDYGMMLLLSDKTEIAAQELKHALMLDPDLIFARRTLGEIYASRGLHEEAVEQWKEALSSEPNDVKTLTILGVHMAKQGLVDEAKESLQWAYILARENPDVINGYAFVLNAAGDYLAARQIVHAGGQYYEGNPSFERLRSEILAGK